MQFASVTILMCFLFIKAYSLCDEILIPSRTDCDTVADVKTYGNAKWVHVIIGRPENDPNPNQTLEGDVFHNCTNLERLSLIGTMNKINSSTLMPLRKLAILYLYKNSLRTFSDSVIAAVPSISSLYLQDNDIEELTCEGPITNSALKLVNLSHNKLRRLSCDTFKIAGFETLKIPYNEISEIHPSNIFSPDLKYLNMDNNLLSTIPAEVFKDMDKLRDLILSNNQFAILQVKYQLKALRYLDLSHNRISFIAANVFDGMPELKNLHLNHNLIRQLPVTVFQPNLRNLKVWALYLHNNRIESLEFLVKHRWASLGKLTIAENPLTCDCLNSFLTFMNSVGLQLSSCDKSYLNSGNFPVCINVRTSWENGKCVQRKEPGNMYDEFLRTPKNYTYKHKCHF